MSLNMYSAHPSQLYNFISLICVCVYEHIIIYMMKFGKFWSKSLKQSIPNLVIVRIASFISFRALLCELSRLTKLCCRKFCSNSTIHSNCCQLFKRKSNSSVENFTECIFWFEGGYFRPWLPSGKVYILAITQRPFWCET